MTTPIRPDQITQLLINAQLYSCTTAPKGHSFNKFGQFSVKYWPKGHLEFELGGNKRFKAESTLCGLII